MAVKKISQELIEWGVKNHAQDLYVLPSEEKFIVSFRYDQEKVVYKELEKELGEKLIFHFKFIGGMDVGEKRKTQIGAATYRIAGVDRRIRLSTVGDFRQRESLVIRFLHSFGESPERFFLPQQIQTIQKQIKKRGLYLFCGPVGSGKTTTMYKLAKESGKSRQIISVEDPVEIEEESFLQLQTNHKIELTYDALIKLCLRHRPDILIIGEIRDTSTAEAAIRAALTGHRVFATLHARNVAGVYARLLELGSQKRELSECLKGIIYQRILPSTLQIDEKYQNAILFDYDFSGEQKKQTRWQGVLRKAWTYGFITNQTFAEEAET
ncbi:competence type IV pilus ATPase ComGA [Enterococcus rivorum]|uniref:Secretion system protein E n=1 Tax=Enterococcus rivorum TaxID=762845 RepID=A0A1E5KZW4_9ENTE|nr:competence type IV pilus ATPase ComGA [Enterococcus rivorum]MBP2099426.1 competence protein ComGA [Enterococcus rivorum]OEH83189.1 secretion system protein E [Enterococcus rivorum]